jgi:hypothetical protein
MKAFLDKKKIEIIKNEFKKIKEDFKKIESKKGKDKK